MPREGQCCALTNLSLRSFFVELISYEGTHTIPQRTVNKATAKKKKKSLTHRVYVCVHYNGRERSEDGAGCHGNINVSNLIKRQRHEAVKGWAHQQKKQQRYQSQEHGHRSHV